MNWNLKLAEKVALENLPGIKYLENAISMFLKSKDEHGYYQMT